MIKEYFDLELRSLRANIETGLLVARRALWPCLLLCLLASTARPQSDATPTDGSTPLGMTPGGPAGSYPLSGFDAVNLYNGKLTINLPLLGIGGRGAAATHLALSNLSANWQVITHTLPTGNQLFIATGNW